MDIDREVYFSNDVLCSKIFLKKILLGEKKKKNIVNSEIEIFFCGKK